MKGNSQKTAAVLNCLIIAAMLVILALFIALPFLQETVTRYFIYFIPAMFFFYTAGGLGLWFLSGLHRLILSVRAGNPFVRKNVVILKQLSLSLFFLMLDFIFIFCFVPSISKLLCICLLILGVFCARVLASLINRAAEYREEIDLTV